MIPAFPVPRPKAIASAALVLVSLLGAGTCDAAAKEEYVEAVRKDVGVTVYNGGYGLVRETRALDLEEGEQWVRCTDVPERIDRTSVYLRDRSGAGIVLLEQNYRYDLVSSEKILERYVDRLVTILMEDQKLREGRLLSARGDQIVLQLDGGGIEMLRREKVIDIGCKDLPGGLITRPTLAWLIESPRACQAKVEVGYLTDGIGWHAEYVGVLEPHEEAMEFAGWVSVENNSGATYEDAELQLVAGDVRRAPARARYRDEVMALEAAAAPRGKPFEEEAFFEYHLYTLPRRTTIRDREQKQIALFEPARVAVEKRYECLAHSGKTNPSVLVSFTNDSKSGLGIPLPAGNVRCYKRDSGGRLQFIGEDRIEHTPSEEEVKLSVGKAFDIVVEQTVADTRKIDSHTREEDVEFEVRNHKDVPVSVDVKRRIRGYWEIRKSSMEYEKKKADEFVFHVEVGAKGSKRVTYTIRFGW